MRFYPSALMQADPPSGLAVGAQIASVVIGAAALVLSCIAVIVSVLTYKRGAKQRAEELAAAVRHQIDRCSFFERVEDGDSGPIHVIEVANHSSLPVFNVKVALKGSSKYQVRDFEWPLLYPGQVELTPPRPPHLADAVSMTLTDNAGRTWIRRTNGTIESL